METEIELGIAMTMTEETEIASLKLLVDDVGKPMWNVAVAEYLLIRKGGEDALVDYRNRIGAHTHQ